VCLEIIKLIVLAGSVQAGCAGCPAAPGSGDIRAYTYFRFLAKRGITGKVGKHHIPIGLKASPQIIPKSHFFDE
jgi:hypothetical protein